MSKLTCINCEKDLGLNRFKCKDGWVCPDCFKKCGYNWSTPIQTKNLSDIKTDFEANSNPNNSSASTTKKCQYCQKDIEINATACPYCHRTQFSFLGAILGIIIFLLLFFISYKMITEFVWSQAEKDYTRIEQMVK
ncbi:hypothetical protein D3C72_1720210 [compost metagenome]